ncbi:heterokaryon incompatibility protein-domain-containing protein [Nemania sp. FL0031]|nr:heterokaryon incompatibility protein-domain-containing protein [Nemania sp. FL0031]
MDPAPTSSSSSRSPPDRIQLSRADAINYLVSDAFREALKELPAGVERSRRLSIVAEALFEDSSRSKSLGSLNHAIQFARDALEELPSGHGDIPGVADRLIFFAQTKAVFAAGMESTSGYIDAVQVAVNATQSGRAHDNFVQRLGWAYWARFELSKSDEDLEATITHITTKAHVLDHVLPNSNLVLGLALHARFTRGKNVDDLNEAIKLLETALKDPEAGGANRHVFLMHLVQYSLEGTRHGDAVAGLSRLVANAKLALPDLPNGEKKDYVEDLVSKSETTLELIQQRPTLNSIFETLGDLNLNEESGPAPIGKTYVPAELYSICPVGKDLIRTLELLPGKDDDEIVCNLATTELNDDTQFEALSYTWGDPDKVTEIIIGQYKCQVTVNLSRALRHLRLPNKPRILWADAVCINQRDTTEKTQQVAMMGDIYLAASQVLTWIGEPSTDSKSVPNEVDKHQGSPQEPEKVEWYTDNDITLMRQFFTNEQNFDDWPVVGALSILALLARNAHLNTLPFFQDPRYPDFNIGIYPSELWQKSSKTLVALLESPYWSRVWIVQEMVLGRRVLIHYGRHVLPLQLFIDAEKSMREHYHGCCYEHCAADPNNKWSYLYGILKNLSTIRYISRMRVSRRMSDKLALFDTMLGGVDFRKATDPRDQVYGLLGLVSEHTEGDLLRPDYSLPVSKVYSRACCKIMQNSKNLRLLSYADRQSSVDTLPSWCHDFDASSPFNPNPYYWDFFNACNGEKFSAELRHNAELLVVGYQLDVITDITEPRTPESLSVASLSRWIDDSLKLVLKKCAAREGAYLNDPQIHVEEAFARTVIGDTITCSDGSTRRAVVDDIELFYRWDEWVRGNIPAHTRDWAARQCPPAFHEISKSFLDRTQSRKLFITKDGRVGTGVATVFGQEKQVLVGDHVFLLQGSNVPVILRPLMPKLGEEAPADPSVTVATSSAPGYAFVGTAYIHGIMDGEACPSDGLFSTIALGQYTKPSPAINGLMRDALRMSLILGHGSAQSSLGQTPYAPSFQASDDKAQPEKGKDTTINAEAFLFPDGRLWDESFKRIPPHRVFLNRLYQNMPTTEEGWQELEEEMETKLRKDQEGRRTEGETPDNFALE